MIAPCGACLKQSVCRAYVLEIKWPISVEAVSATIGW
jgi:hypothetical protein